ncbi:MAG: hypothetical protein ABI298_02800 [Acidimicrobiales bacterium]
MTNFAGTWDVTLDTPIGKMAVVFEITESDGVITGVARSDAESVDFQDTISEGDRLTWSQAVTTPMRLTLKFDVAVDGDTMSGTSRAGVLSSKVNGHRVAAS